MVLAERLSASAICATDWPRASWMKTENSRSLKVSAGLASPPSWASARACAVPASTYRWPRATAVTAVISASGALRFVR